MDVSGLAGLSGAVYLLTVLFVAVDALVPPVPAEVVVITSAALAARGQLNPVLACAAAALGSWLGDLLVYYLFKRRLAGVLDRWRWGRAAHRGARDAALRAGDSSTFAALVSVRFLPAGRTASMAAAGLAGVETRRLASASAIGSTLWALWMFCLGWATGSVKELPWWVGSLVGIALGLLCGAAAAGVLRLRARRARLAAGLAAREAEPADTPR
ncbi:VTT domain-containing protein [Paenarthrobacter sp. DKR-5]|uniref:DedA family protein n=1 Tax=Paenarthrobacter sp. DKR-5 TaxID=2835535 RepID=UPI001BDD057F|nr:VTT domain-containing protein [Paenarthrobacter sp. DKR-5]MBT1003509.1 VTT domain-containing protein [Paenarthrobacter sp. DKR-5]